MASIPASAIVNINANVLSAGGSVLAMNGVILTDNTLLVPHTLVQFSSAADVSDFFGSTSTEFDMATVYFNGYSIAQSKPGLIYFYRMTDAASPAYLEGASLSLTLAQLQALTPSTIAVTVSGVLKTSSSIDLSAATSFADAATIITAAFTSPGFAVTWVNELQRFLFTTTATGAAVTLTYASGTLATDLKLTLATGANLVQGAAADNADLAGYMNDLVDLSQNWATFTTSFETALADAKGFVDWVNGKNAEYVFINYTSDSTENTRNTATDNISNYIQNNDKANTFLIGQQNGLTVDLALLAAFTQGVAASIDFNQQNNRPTFAFKNQTGLPISVNNQSIGDILILNGINFFGDYATRADEFKFLYPGSVSGTFQWMDSLINAIYMKAKMQQTLMTLLVSVPSIPYNLQGYHGFIQTSLADDLASFLNYGAIRTGIRPTSTQAAAVNSQAGLDISQALFNQGYYLQVKDPGGTARQNRTSPIINLWYMDGGAVQKINMTATLVQ